MIPPGALLDAASPEVLGALVTYLRVQAVVISLPAFSERTLPVRLRVALAVALTPMFVGAGVDSLVLPAAGAVAVGLVQGTLVRILASALTIAASAIAASASLSQLFGADTEMSPHPIGNLMHLAGLAVLMALGFPVFVVDYLAAGFALWPPGALPDVATLLPHLVGLTTHAFSLALVLASPFILGGFLFQCLSGVVNRVMPALPVVFVAAPAAILMALLALTVLTVPVVTLWAQAVLSMTLEGPPR